MKLSMMILCFVISGCASAPIQTNQERKTIDIYDTHGKVKEHVIIKDDHITIYDKEWKSKGYGTVKP